MKKKLFIILSTATIIGIGALYVMNNIKKKRRRLLTPEEGNRVSKDFGGKIPGPLYKYLRGLGESGREKENISLWGYSKVLEHSRAVFGGPENDIVILFGVHNEMTEKLGKTTYIMYTKESYPESLVLVSWDKDTHDLEVVSEVDFNALF